MNDPTDISADHGNLLPIDSAVQEPPAETEVDNERVKSALARLTSNSAKQFEELASSFQDVREFLRLEGERMQREVANYAILQQSVASAATKILANTLGRKSATVAGEEPKQVFSVREKLKRWPSG